MRQRDWRGRFHGPDSTTVEERFWAKVQKTENCWLWTGATIRGGYGSFGGVNGKVGSAHRFSWQLHNGPIPEGFHVLHLCDNPPCINPGHLWLGTDLDNARDRERKGRGYNWNAHKTHCRHGHPLAGGNVGLDRGCRFCKTCRKAQALKYKMVG